MKPELLGKRLRPWVSFTLMISCFAFAWFAVVGLAVAYKMRQESERRRPWEPTPDLSAAHVDHCFYAINGDMRCRVTPLDAGVGPDAE